MWKDPNNTMKVPRCACPLLVAVRSSIGAVLHAKEFDHALLKVTLAPRWSISLLPAGPNPCTLPSYRATVYYTVP